MKVIPLSCALFFACAPTLLAQVPGFAVTSVQLDTDGDLKVEVPATAGSYYLLTRHASSIPADAVLPPGDGTSVLLRDPSAKHLGSAIYRVEQIPFGAPGDADNDGIDDLFELQHPLILSPTDPTDAADDSDEDGESNLAEYHAKSDPAELIVTEVSFVTSDNITLRGTLRRLATRSDVKPPVLVFIHQGFRSRSEWNPFLPAFSAAGYSTLAYDTRGSGLSGGSFSSADFDDPNTVPKDVEAALAFVRNLPTTDAEKVAIVGSSVGGNLACVASQKRWVKTAVNISGKTSAVRNLAAETDLDLGPMYHIASSGDGGGQRAIWANELFGFSSEPREVEVVPGSSTHGVAVITASPGLLDRMIAWLDETL